MKSIINKYYFSLIILLCLLPAVVPIFQPYVSGTADGLGHRFRLVSFYNSLSQGILRPRWASEAALGYGAPTFLFNYSLPYYLTSLLHKAGFTVNQSGQLLSALALVLSGFAMYILGKKLTGNKVAGLVAAIVYVYAPYHLLMTYLYDAWGEELAFVFPPLILYLVLCLIGQIRQIGQIRKTLFFIFHFSFLILSWVLFILSHNVSSVMFAPVLLILSLVILVIRQPAEHPGSRWDSGLARMTLFLVINSFILAVLISAFFWLPAFVLQSEMKYPAFLAGESWMRGSFFKSFSFQLGTSLNVMKEGITHYLDFTIGLPILLVILLSLIRLISPFRNIRKIKKAPMADLLLGYLPRRQAGWVIGLLVVFVMCLYFTNYMSNWLWGIFYFHFILYPFRFLFPAAFLGAILSGLVINHYYRATVYGSNVRKMMKWIGIAVFMVFCLLQGLPYTKPYIDIFPFSGDYFYRRQTVSSAPLTQKNMLIREFLPVRADDLFLLDAEEKDKREEMEITKGLGTIKIISSQSERIIALIEAKENITLTVNRFYFPNWEIYDNGRMIPVAGDNHGRMAVNLNSGNHDLRIVFGVTAIEKLAYMISIIGIIMLVGEMIYINKELRIKN